MAATIQIKRGTSTDWSTANPILASGELGLDTTLNNIKVGDGITAWNSLNFYDSNSQPLDSTLTAIATFNTNGFLVQTSPDNFAGRIITAASTKIQINNGNGVASNPSIDVNESNLALNNIGGTLSIAKGGTNSTTSLNNNRIINSVGGAIVERSAMTDGQLIIGSTGGNPVNATLTQGDNTVITNGAGTISILAIRGSENVSANVTARTTTTSSTYQTKVTLNTGSLTTTSVYRIDFSAVLDSTSANRNINFRIYNSTNSTVLYEATDIRVPNAASTYPISGFVEFTVGTSGARTILLQWNSDNNSSTIGIAYAYLDFYRIR